MHPNPLLQSSAAPREGGKQAGPGLLLPHQERLLIIALCLHFSEGFGGGLSQGLGVQCDAWA